MGFEGFLGLYMPQSNRIIRVAFGDRPEMNGQTVQLFRTMPSGFVISQTVTYNSFNLPAGSTYVTATELSPNYPYVADLVVSTPASNSLTYYVNLGASGQPVPNTVPLGAPAAKVFLASFDALEINNDFLVQTTDGRLGLSFSGNPPIYVTTGVDEDDGTTVFYRGDGCSLREALNYANAVGGRQTIKILTREPLDVSAFAQDASRPL
jgi:CSLREA domain-containing protein